MNIRSVTEWYQIIQDSNDMKLARQVLDDLLDDEVGNHDRREDLQQLVNLFNAIRLDQMVKENR